MMRDNRFESIDKAALAAALLQLHTCPKCRVSLESVGTPAKKYSLWACSECGTTWQVPWFDADGAR